MTTPLSHDPKVPVYGGEAEGTYTIEMIAELAGVDSRTVLHYQESGFIRPVETYGWEGTPVFDDECFESFAVSSICVRRVPLMTPGLNSSSICCGKWRGFDANEEFQDECGPWVI
jgi:hypothetical protein